MATQGVQSNLLNFQISQDKNLKGLFASLSQGDTLKGRVIDIIAAENKAVINFRGYNVVSQLPQGAALKKGDMINVQVTGTGDSVTMKLLQGPVNTGIVNPGQLSALSQGDAEIIAGMLNEMKLPVNEQNIYIGRKLAENGVPVTRENLNQVNNSLLAYMQQKGIEPESVFVNKSEPQAGQAAFKEAAASFIKMFSAVSEADTVVKDNSVNSSVKTAVRQQAAAEFMAELNKIAAVIRESGNNMSMTAELRAGSAILTAGNISNETIRALSASLSGGLLQFNDAAKIMSAASNQGKPFQASIMGGKADIRFSQGKLEITFNNAAEIIASVFPGADAGTPAKVFESLGKQNQGILNDRSNLNSGLTALKGSGIPQAENILKQLAVFAEISEPSAAQVKQAAENILKFSVLAAKAAGEESASIPVKTAADFTAKFITHNEINMIASGMKTVSSGQAAQISEFASAIAGRTVPNNADISQKPAAAVASALSAMQTAPFEAEPVIDAVAFLMSRNIPADNARIIDVMKSYFSEGTRLNKAVNNITRTFESLMSINEIKSGLKDNASLIKTIADIKNAIIKMQIDMNEGSVSLTKTEAGLRDFPGISGLNTENRLLKQALPELKDILPAKVFEALGGNERTAFVREAGSSEAAKELPIKENFKSLLFKADSELGNAIQNTNDAHLKKALVSAKDAVQEALTSLNAAQLLNHKPAAFEMLYTQIPVFFENKMFNGELQVWYKKGSVKEQLNKSEPVNMLFVLNTSRLGTVRVSMTVYKNDVDCVIKTENEKAKQAIMRSREDFISGVNGANFSLKSLNVTVDDMPKDEETRDAGYINLGKINIQA